MKRILIASLALLVLSACKKEGCTDSVAKNYNSEAKKDDGSCTFESSTMIWFDSSTSYKLMSENIVELVYYIDGTSIGQNDFSDYYTVAPSCGATQAINYKKALGTSKTSTSTYEVRKSDGTVLDSGTISFKAGECTAIEFEY